MATQARRASAKTAYLPFSQGPRTGPGVAFATQEALLILAQVVRRYHLAPVPGRTPTLRARLTLRCVNGVQLRLTRVTS